MLAGARLRFAASFAIGTLIRLVVLVWSQRTPFTSDAADYVEAANRLLRGVHFVPYWPSGLPLYLAGWLAIGAGELGLRAAMLLFWALLAWGIWRVACELGFARWAWALMLLLAVMPASVHLSIEPLTQQPVAALLTDALALALAVVRRHRWPDAALLGLSLGWMILVRPSAMSLLITIPAMCLFADWVENGGIWWAGGAVAVSLGLVAVGGWMLRAHTLSGAWMINSSNGLNFYDGNNPWTPLYKTWYFGSHAKPGSPESLQYPGFTAVLDRVNQLPPLAASAEFQRLAIENIRQHPGTFLLRTSNRMRCFFGFPTFTSLNLRSSGALGRRLFPMSLALEAAVYLILVGPAVFWIASASGAFWRRWEAWLFLASVVLYAVPYFISMSHPTYNYPVVMPLALIGAFAWIRTVRAERVRWRGWIAVGVLLAIQVEWVVQSARG